MSICFCSVPFFKILQKKGADMKIFLNGYVLALVSVGALMF